MDDVNSSVNVSIDDNKVLVVPEDNLLVSENTKHKYSVCIRLQSTGHLFDLCKHYLDNLTDEKVYDYEQKFWISWVLMNRSFQTDEFTIYGGINRTKDEFVVECSSIDSLLSYFHNFVSPLRVFLCTDDGNIIGKLDVPIQFKLSDGNDLCDAYMKNGEYLLENLYDNNCTIQATLCIDFEVVCVDETEPIVDPPLEESPQLPVEINEEDYQSNRYRLSIDVKSIKGLKRPAYAGINFKYPYLGSTNVIRTHPMWSLANTETRIDNAKASYDCSMNKIQMKEILSKHPLIVQVISRSSSIQDILGECTVNMSNLLDSNPISYRCSITGKTFKTLSEYQTYRYNLINLHTTGKIEQIPNKNPIVIYSIDSYYSIKISDQLKSDSNFLSTVEGSKLHIVIILEDLGLISKQLSTDVKLGYKMHNGGLYDIPIELNNNSKEIIDYNNINEMKNLTEYEKIHLEKLILDYENWRKKNEILFIESLNKKEILLKENLEKIYNEKLIDKSNDLINKQNDIILLEIKLKKKLNEIETIKNNLIIKENLINNKLIQKSDELLLLSNKIKLDYQIKLSNELNKNKLLNNKIINLEDIIEKNNKNYKILENEYDNYRNVVKNTSEYQLKEENYKLNIKINELKYLIENKSKEILNVIIEKDYYKSQMNRLAIGLKREREKSNILARQDIEQLRLEFLAREERYILDGDRDELRNIRNELSTLRHNIDKSSNLPTYSQEHKPIVSKLPSYTHDNISNEQKSLSPTSSIPSFDKVSMIKQQINELLSTGLYNDDDEVILELNKVLESEEENHEIQ